MNATPVTVLIIDDDPVQVQAISNLFAAANGHPFELDSAGSLSEGEARLASGRFEIVLLDLGLPDSCGMETFTKLHRRFPGLPVVVFTSLEDEGVGLELVHDGAQDYLIKGQVSSLLLSRTVRYAIERKRAATEREQLIGELREALASVKTLSGLVPICASCKKIRDDKGFWSQVETFVAKHSMARFSHGICPDCAKTLYPDVVRLPAGVKFSVTMFSSRS